MGGTMTVSIRSAPGGFRVLHDPAGYAESGGAQIRQLPGISIELVLHDGVLLPVQRGLIQHEHPNWETIVQPGRIWQEEGDGGFVRASLPFALQERNANCTHYGVLTWVFDRKGDLSRIAYQVVSETCAYFKFDMWGLLDAELDVDPQAVRPDIVDSYRRHRSQQLPVRPFQHLADAAPGIDLNAFGVVDGMNPGDMTTYGLVAGDVHYRSNCPTRFGAYPFCESIPLPSYSTAKTIFAGVALMHLEKVYPGARDLTIDVLISECRKKKWKGVRIEDALDMSTGNFKSAVPHEDEAGDGQIGFLYDESHFEKLEFACNFYPHKEPPGKQWVYHTSDTYLAGTAMENLLYAQFGKPVDLYSDLVLPFWRALGLSPLLEDTKRSYDDERQPFFGWGLTYEPDDIARIARWIDQQHGKIQGKAVLDAHMLDSAMQRNADDRGLEADGPAFRYNNGFYAHDISAYIDCPHPVWVPFMAGYGGIAVVMFPNDFIYYYFTDGFVQRWRLAAIELDKLNGMCK